MFTGLVSEIGRILAVKEGIRNNDEQYRLMRVAAHTIMRRMRIGDSINVNGVCQTVVAKSSVFSRLWGNTWFEIESLGITLEKTNFSLLKRDDFVNLEPSLRLSDRLGGHIVTGHVKETAVIIKKKREGDNLSLFIELSDHLRAYGMEEGSITVEGISLTIAQIEKNTIMCNIIPHTEMHTTIQYMEEGDKVNIEVDMIIQYIATLYETKMPSRERQK